MVAGVCPSTAVKYYRRWKSLLLLNNLLSLNQLTAFRAVPSLPPAVAVRGPFGRRAPPRTSAPRPPFRSAALPRAAAPRSPAHLRSKAAFPLHSAPPAPLVRPAPLRIAAPPRPACPVFTFVNYFCQLLLSTPFVNSFCHVRIGSVIVMVAGVCPSTAVKYYRRWKSLLLLNNLLSLNQLTAFRAVPSLPPAVAVRGPFGRRAPPRTSLRPPAQPRLTNGFL